MGFAINPNTHEVKTNASVFQEVWTGRKCAELRLDDRDYCIGDIVVQREWKPSKQEYTGRSVTATITAITRISHWIADVDYRWVILHFGGELFVRARGGKP